MQKFPIKIDLSRFFKDERKFVILLVNPSWNSVESLQQRVEQIFNVYPVHFLTSDDFFIPPQESIEVVKFADSLKAFIPGKALDPFNKNSRHYANVNGETKNLSGEEATSKQDTENSNKKRKCVTVAGNGLSHRKRSKLSKVWETQICQPISNADPNPRTDSVPNCLPENKKSKKKNKNALIFETDIIEQNEPIIQDIHKQKQSKSFEHEDIDIPITDKVVQRVDVDESCNQLRVISHIHNKETQRDVLEVVGEQTSLKTKKINFSCGLDSVAKAPAIFPLKSIRLYRQGKNTEIHIQENIMLPIIPLNIISQNGENLVKCEMLQANNNECSNLICSDLVENKLEKNDPDWNNKNNEKVSETNEKENKVGRYLLRNLAAIDRDKNKYKALTEEVKGVEKSSVLNENLVINLVDNADQ